jgi:hypothetical protein
MPPPAIPHKIVTWRDAHATNVTCRPYSGRVSAIAWFYLIERDQLASSPKVSWVMDHGREIDPDYPYSGYLMVSMLTYLDSHDIPIMSSTLDATPDDGSAAFATVLTVEHRPLIPDLDSGRFTPAEMREALDEDGELLDEEVDEAFSDTLTLLSRGIADLAESEALVIVVG